MGHHVSSCQSLLLSTIVLYDYWLHFKVNVIKEVYLYQNLFSHVKILFLVSFLPFEFFIIFEYEEYNKEKP